MVLLTLVLKLFGKLQSEIAVGSQDFAKGYFLAASHQCVLELSISSEEYMQVRRDLLALQTFCLVNEYSRVTCCISVLSVEHKTS